MARSLVDEDAARAFVWFEGVRVERSDMGLCCIVNGKTVPFPVVILHPACTLENAGDEGALGVPTFWAREHGLLPPN